MRISVQHSSCLSSFETALLHHMRCPQISHTDINSLVHNLRSAYLVWYSQHQMSFFLDSQKIVQNAFCRILSQNYAHHKAMFSPRYDWDRLYNRSHRDSLVCLFRGLLLPIHKSHLLHPSDIGSKSRYQQKSLRTQSILADLRRHMLSQPPLSQMDYQIHIY